MAITPTARMSSTIVNAVRNTSRIGRTRAAQHAENAEREGGVGSDRDAPAAQSIPAEIEQHVCDRRHDCAPNRGRDWQCRLANMTQFAHENFSLDLEAEDEEEQRHQSVVNPVPKRRR